jgi:hypothetical protein
MLFNNIVTTFIIDKNVVQWLKNSFFNVEVRVSSPHITT